MLYTLKRIGYIRHTKAPAVCKTDECAPSALPQRVINHRNAEAYRECHGQPCNRRTIRPCAASSTTAGQRYADRQADYYQIEHVTSRGNGDIPDMWTRRRPATCRHNVVPRHTIAPRKQGPTQSCVGIPICFDPYPHAAPLHQYRAVIARYDSFSELPVA